MHEIRLPRLHVITDTRGPFAAQSGAFPDPSRPAARPDPLSVVSIALAAGARLIQIRPEDHYTDRAAYDFAEAVAALCDAHGATCLVNDRAHIALAVGADGVHLGAEDLPVDAARRILPDTAIIGGTCRNPESARAARRAGATYLGVGPVWGTTTKTGLPQPIGLEGLAAVCAAVDLPVIAIGGITAERAARCREAGAHGVAVVGAIASAADPAAATRELLAAVGERTAGAAAAPILDAQSESRAAEGARAVRAGADRDDPSTVVETADSAAAPASARPDHAAGEEPPARIDSPHERLATTLTEGAAPTGAPPPPSDAARAAGER